MPVRLVRRPSELEDLAGLVIPGGESTTIGMLMDRNGLLDATVRAVTDHGLPIMGTCAGAILLASEIEQSTQPRLGLMDMRVARNAYGRQIDSFEADVAVPALGDEAVRGVFIRAPQIVQVGSPGEILARYEGRAVVVRQGNRFALTFHPELTGDYRLHRYFLAMTEAPRQT